MNRQAATTQRHDLERTDMGGMGQSCYNQSHNAKHFLLLARQLDATAFERATGSQGRRIEPAAVEDTWKKSLSKTVTYPSLRFTGHAPLGGGFPYHGLRNHRSK